MDNKTSNVNPSIKSVATPVANSSFAAKQPNMIPPQAPVSSTKMNVQNSVGVTNPQVTTILPQVGAGAKPMNLPGRQTKTVTPQKKGQAAGAKPEEKEQIRIVIRDAKPPLLARILQAIMRLICLVLIIAVCGIGVPKIFGINEFNVLTGSMTPTYPIGTLVFVQPKDPSTIRPGEVVTVIMNENLDMVTHRVTANNYENKTLVTKGDANQTEDAPHLYENVVGVVCFAVPYVGGVVDYVTNDQKGRIIGIGIVLAILALTFIAEGICYLLTKQSANIFQSNTKKKTNYKMKSINAHKFNRQYKRGKGKKIPSVSEKVAAGSQQPQQQPPDKKDKK